MIGEKTRSLILDLLLLSISPLLFLFLKIFGIKVLAIQRNCDLRSTQKSLNYDLPTFLLAFSPLDENMSSWSKVL